MDKKEVRQKFNNLKFLRILLTIIGFIIEIIGLVIMNRPLGKTLLTVGVLLIVGFFDFYPFPKSMTEPKDKGKNNK